MTRTELNQWAEEKARHAFYDPPFGVSITTCFAAALMEAYEAGQRDLGERACATVCYFCDECNPIAGKTEGTGYWHETGELCMASAIRVAMEEGKP